MLSCLAHMVLRATAFLYLFVFIYHQVFWSDILPKASPNYMRLYMKKKALNAVSYVIIIVIFINLVCGTNIMF